MDWRRRSVLLFLAVCFLLRNQAAAGDNTWDLTEEEDSELERELKTLNKPYVKSFKDEYGITYDCVDIYKQPAFDHPLLKNHTLQFPKRSDNTNKVSIIKQTLPKLCPTGTVLIKRTTKEDLMRARKYAHQIQSRMQLLQAQIRDSSGDYHYAGVEFAAGQGPKYYGASANLDVFQLSGVSHNQQSETQIVLSKGAGGPKNYIDTVQAGWLVNPGLQGDDRAHFYTYWTSDGYQKTGCFNLDCPGFVQTSTRITPGMVYTLSTLSLTIYRDRFTSNWMLYNDREPVGYWPKEIFNNMADCSLVQMHGNVYSPFDEPSPPMGSGVLNQAKFTNIFLTDGQGNNRLPKNFKELNDLGERYYGVDYRVQNGGMFYGGPGGWKKT